MVAPLIDLSNQGSTWPDQTSLVPVIAALLVDDQSAASCGACRNILRHG
jgi:hypothetical protein